MLSSLLSPGPWETSGGLSVGYADMYFHLHFLRSLNGFMCLSKTIAVKQSSLHLSQTVINNMFLFCFHGISSDSKRADIVCYQQILEARYVIQAGAYRIVVQSVLITRLRLQLSAVSAQLWGLSWASCCTCYTKYSSYHQEVLRSSIPNPFPIICTSWEHLHIQSWRIGETHGWLSCVPDHTIACDENLQTGNI